MSSVIEFSGDPTTLIRISNLEKFKDGGSYRGDLTIRSGHFGCDGRPFYFDDLEGFLNHLEVLFAKLQGSATLRPTYEPDFIAVEAIGSGHITIRGEIYEPSELAQVLKFSFKSDQSFLPPFIRSIREALSTLKTG